LSQAFDNVVVSKEDWELIYKGIMKEANSPPPEQVAQEGQDSQAAQQGADRQQQMVIEKMKAGQQGAQGGAGGAPGGGPQIDDIASIVQEVAKLIDGLPQEMKRSLGVQLAQGRSVADIASQMIGQMQHSAAA